MPARYYKRRRTLPVLQDDGTLTAPVEAMTTRFYFGLRRKKPHNVYYHGGKFYRVKAVPTAFADDGAPAAWTHALAPIEDERCFDRFLAQTLDQGKAAPVTLHVVDGRATATGCKGTGYDGVPFLDGTEDAGYIEDQLDLKPTERRRPTAA